MTQSKIIMYTSPDMAARIKKIAARKNIKISSLMKVWIYDQVREDERKHGEEPKTEMKKYDSEICAGS